MCISKKLSAENKMMLPIKTVYDKVQHNEFVRYLIGGGTVTVLNAGIYTVLVLFAMKPRWANLIALAAAKVYGYFINKFFVYQSRGLSAKDTRLEFAKYLSARGLTGLVDYVLVLLLAEGYGFNAFYTKYGVMILVILLNYFFGKFWVFKNGGNAK